jgi:hypothetical protein
MQMRQAEHRPSPEHGRQATPGAGHGYRGEASRLPVRGIGDALAGITGPRSARIDGLLLQLQRALGNRYVRQAMVRARQATVMAPVVQPKLVVGPADDHHEREADRISREVGRRAARRPAIADLPRAHHPQVIRRVAVAEGGVVDDGLRQAIGQARGSGRPVPAGLRGPMEQALGADFSRVRLHADAQADRFTRALQARAFTTGRDIFFRRGDYNPGSPRGRQLLAHELAHVVQQGGGTSNAAPALQREVIQRVLTDEAQRVLDLANDNQPDFTRLPDKEGLLGDRADALVVLKNKYILASHLQDIMQLPPGAPAGLRDFVQAWLLRHLAARFLSYIFEFGNIAEEKRVKFIERLVADVLEIKDALVAAGYGQPGEMAPELKSVIARSFGESGVVPLDFDAHGVQHVPAADPRKIEVCATYIPGRKLDILGRVHSFILYTDASGKIIYLSAHDDGTGTLRAEYGVWSPSVFDDKNFDRVVVATGHAASAAFPAMLDAVENINSAGVKYKMTEQNCNSATHYILKAANFAQAQAPSFMTGQFGWSKKLEKKINRPLPVNPAMAALPPAQQMPSPTVTTTQTVTGPTATTTQPIASTAVGAPPQPGSWRPVAPSSRIRSVGKTRPRLQPRTSPRVLEAEEPAEPASPRGRGGMPAPDFDQDTYTLAEPVAAGALEIAAGHRITVIKISTSNNVAHIQVVGREGTFYVALDELENAIGRQLR